MGSRKILSNSSSFFFFSIASFFSFTLLLFLPPLLLSSLLNRRKIPATLASEIASFHFEDFTKKNFKTHKKGILRRKVPLADQMCWAKDPIPGPLMNMSKQNAKEAVNCFKLLQRAMKDKGTLKGTIPQGFQPLVEIAINHPEMRDELYVQLCKQLTKNPTA